MYIMPFALALHPKHFSLQLFGELFEPFQHSFVHDFCEVHFFEIIKLVFVLLNVVFSARDVDSYDC